MLIRVCLGLMVMIAIPAWSQAQEDFQDQTISADDSQMQTPPPISDQPYPTQTGNEVRSNYLSLGAGFSTGYVDNLYPGATAAPLSETFYSINPAVSFDERTGRQQATIAYLSGYTFYHPNSILNFANQSLTALYSYRFTPHVTLVTQYGFTRTSNLYGQPGQVGTNGVSGSLQPSTQGILAPFASQRTNAVNAELTVQTSRTVMVGGSFEDMTLHYLNPAQAAGLSDGSALGGTGFFNRRLGQSQYIGANYQYSRMQSSLLNTNFDLLTHTIEAFYTFYFDKNFSVSVAAGPEHYQMQMPQFPSNGSWTPSAVASLGWQGPTTSFSLSYSRAVGGGGGLIGASTSDIVDAEARWQISRSWATGVGANYANNGNATQFIPAGFVTGHSIAGTATIERRLSALLEVQFAYMKIHESYGGIPALAANPDSSSETVYLTWQLRRPLGR